MAPCGAVSFFFLLYLFSLPSLPHLLSVPSLLPRFPLSFFFCFTCFLDLLYLTCSLYPLCLPLVPSLLPLSHSIPLLLCAFVSCSFLLCFPLCTSAPLLGCRSLFRTCRLIGGPPESVHLEPGRTFHVPRTYSGSLSLICFPVLRYRVMNSQLAKTGTPRAPGTGLRTGNSVVVSAWGARC